MKDRIATDERARCAEYLSTFRADLRWVLADSALLQAIASDQPVERGSRGRLLRSLLRWADHLSLTGLLVLAVGFADLLMRLREQGRHPAANGSLVRLFVGFGAGAEEALFAGYSSESSLAVSRVNQTDMASFGRIHRLGSARALRVFWSAHRTALNTVRALPSPLAPWRVDFLTFAGMRLGGYSFMRAWFESLRDGGEQLSEVCFLAADTPAFAAADAGLPTRYIQHGFVRRSLLWPEFQAVDAMTRDEAIHFRRTLPLARINVTLFTELDESELTNGVLIASVYERRDEMRRILPFIYWARANGWQVWVRPKPREDRSFWIQEVVDSNLVRIEDGDATFFDALSRLRPRIVASWYSTALADALNSGIVPVTINDETTPAVADMVYPLLERALQWPRDEEQLVRLMGDGETYRAFVSSLRGDMSAAGV